MLVVPNASLLALATSIFRGTGDWVDVVVKLYQDNITPGPATELADLLAAEADFTGYAEQAIASYWGVPYLNAAGKVSVDGTTMANFTQSATTTSNSIYGYFITDSAETGLICAEKFPSAVPMAAVGAHIGVLGRVQDFYANGAGLVSY